jgi:aspartate racemase
MGPAATARFYQLVISATRAARDQDHIPLVIWGDPRIPDRSSALADNGESPLPALVAATRKLVDAGSTLLAMPCNSAHAYLPELRSVASPVPFIDIVDETVRAVRGSLDGVGSVAVFATRGTLATLLYQDRLEAAGVRLVLPSESQQQQIDLSISYVKGGRIIEAAGRLVRVAREMARVGIDAIVAACTELAIPLELRELQVPVIDSNAALAAGVVARIRGEADYNPPLADLVSRRGGDPK